MDKQRYRLFAKSFAKRLTGLMNEKGVNKTILAKTIGVSRSTIVSWCEGRTVPYISKVVLLVKFFGVSSDYLAGLTDEKKKVKFL